MVQPILTCELHFEQDVLASRRRARQIAALLGFSPLEQTRLSTAVSEIARNAFRYAGGGKVEFNLEGKAPQMFQIRISDRGPGIAELQAVLEERFQSKTGMGIGIVGTRRLMDRFHIESTDEHGPIVVLGKRLPGPDPVTASRLAEIAEALARRTPDDPLEEIQAQNQEILQTLDLVQRQKAELSDTNRAIVALLGELEEKADFLSRANDLKSRFLANMSHEFRTPLSSVLSLSRLLLDRTDGELSLEQETQVKLIRSSVKELTNMVDDLLDLARVQAGKVIIHPTSFDVADLISGLRGMFRPLQVSSAVALIFEEPPEHTLYSDEGKISQVLRNLISNALKFTEAGEVRISAAASGNAMVFSVSDSGIGIAPEDEARIFDEFGQLDGPVQRRVKGTGLGLPLSRRLAEVLGGTLTLSRNAHHGSTFAFTVPCQYTGPIEHVEVPDVPCELDPTRFQTLVVEDSREQLHVYEKLLKGSGFQVIPARNIEEARSRLQTMTPVAIILDILMEDGGTTWSFLSELKQSEQTKHIPVFVVTVIHEEKKALVLGADAFSLKPVERGWVLEQMHALTQPSAQELLLIIDDDEVARYVLKRLLADTRYRILEATSGRDGLRMALEHQPGIIFLDMVMPDMTGLQVLEMLKASPETRNIPVIINTSKLLSPQERVQISALSAAILSKQSSSNEAGVSRVREALARSRLSASASATQKEPHNG